jgi:non-specific serine/threonine protein kinase/serine/threonine-protein kinase
MQPERVAQIVEAALERTPEDRARFIEEICGGDADLRREAESLLAFQPDASDFMEQPAYQISGDGIAGAGGELKPGDSIGDYKILSLIGEGGMGEVYLADDLKLGRKIALKLLKLGLGTSNIVRRFQQEERILAGLVHPNIARLYGGSITPNGLPYFVMEYIDGARLDDYCREHKLSIFDRLALFRKICAAVAYAHQRLIIHRDLKPANIRVAREGEPKLLDFGIAKLIDPTTSTIPEMTMTFAAVMTPEYASPEQVRGEAMTTASDVYSLGVILYELLTAQRPYHFKSRNPTETARVIAEQEPARPSAAIAKSGNSKTLRGDLDNIMLKALRKEPERRYPSVTDFSEDIRRFLEDKPVTARKDTFGYRASKFVSRNRVAVAAATAMILLLVAGLVTTVLEAHRAKRQQARAERRFNDLRHLANTLVFELHDAIQNLPGATEAREVLVKRALQYLDSLAKESADDASLQRELASAYVKIGNAQGNPNNANLGDTNGALNSYRRALAISNQILHAHPADLEARRTLAISHEKIGDVQATTGDVPAAVQSARDALAGFKFIADSESRDLRAQRSLAISHIKMGDVLGNSNFPNAGDETGALENYKMAETIFGALDQAHPNTSDLQGWLGRVHERIGTIMEQQGKIDNALEDYRRSQQIRDALARTNPQNADAVRDAAIAAEKMGNVMAARGDSDAALINRRKSLQIFKQLADTDPQNVQAQISLAISHIHLADLLGQSRRDEARENYQRAFAILERVLASGVTDTTVQINLDLIRKRLRE